MIWLLSQVRRKNLWINWKLSNFLLLYISLKTGTFLDANFVLAFILSLFLLFSARRMADYGIGNLYHLQQLQQWYKTLIVKAKLWQMVWNRLSHLSHSLSVADQWGCCRWSATLGCWKWVSYGRVADVAVFLQLVFRSVIRRVMGRNTSYSCLQCDAFWYKIKV